MNGVRPTNPNLNGIVPYDPKYLPADVMVSANENPADVPQDVRDRILATVATMPFNRYPDPLANDLRDALAQAYGLARENVLVGNGGDELLYDIALAWGGQGRELLTFPPTFSTYAASAQLVGTRVVELARQDHFAIPEDATLAHLAQGQTDWVVVCSPNNPTGNLAPMAFVERMLDATDALLVVDEAYGEFCNQSVIPLLARHENLAVLRTFSKAFRLAGVRVGYLLASEAVVRELCKVRQPYSVDAVSQAIALECWKQRDAFDAGTRQIVAERDRVFATLSALPGVEVFPSQANYLLVRMPHAGAVWQALYDAGVLVRDFSTAPLTTDCLRVSIGTPEENDRFLATLKGILA